MLSVGGESGLLPIFSLKPTTKPRPHLQRDLENGGRIQEGKTLVTAATINRKSLQHSYV